jgi:hypothetical protein
MLGVQKPNSPTELIQKRQGGSPHADYVLLEADQIQTTDPASTSQNRHPVNSPIQTAHEFVHWH